MRWAAYHGIRGPNVDADSFTFGGISEYPEGIHLGSLDQARMRAGRGSTIEVTVGRDLIGAEGIKRVQDRSGSWKSIVTRSARAGEKALFYLNRYEGVTNEVLERILEIGSERFDRMSDSEDRKRVPRLSDSWIILDPDILKIERVMSYEEVSELAEAQRKDASEDQYAGSAPTLS